MKGIMQKKCTDSLRVSIISQCNDYRINENKRERCNYCNGQLNMVLYRKSLSCDFINPNKNNLIENWEFEFIGGSMFKNIISMPKTKYLGFGLMIPWEDNLEIQFNLWKDAFTTGKIDKLK